MYTIILNSISKNGMLLSRVFKKFQNNKAIVLAAVRNNGLALEHASKRLKNDKEVVLAAVQNNGSALEYASKYLKDDEEVVLAAVENDTNNGFLFVLEYASKRLRYKREIVLAAVKTNAQAYSCIESYKLLNDEEIVLTAASKDISMLEYATQKIKNNKKFMMTFIQNNASAFLRASDRLQDDKKFIISCIIANKDILDDDIIEELFYENDYELFLLIHNLQHYFAAEDIVLNDLFINNIKYISKTSHFSEILKHILTNQKPAFIDNYMYFVNTILQNKAYVQMCQKHNIIFMNIEDATANGTYDFDGVKAHYERQYTNKVILWYF